MAIIKIKKNLQIINAGEGVEKRELFNTVDENVNQCIPNGEQNGGFFNKTKNRIVICVLT